MSKQREYPFTAYVLTPSMGVKKVELVQKHWYPGWHETLNGVSYREDNLYDTPQAAIAAGRAKLDEQRAKLAKHIENRAANLDKAESKLK